MDLWRCHSNGTSAHVYELFSQSGLEIEIARSILALAAMQEVDISSQ